MAIKKALRSEACLKKISYSAQKDAQRAIERCWRIGKWRSKKGRPLSAYKCPECDQWHTTSQGPRVGELVINKNAHS